MTRRRRKYHGFGFAPDESHHHFALTVDNGFGATAMEHFTWGDGDSVGHFKASLGMPYWAVIAHVVAETFNQRLRRSGLPAGKWERETTLLAPHFGKELVLLMWALDGAAMLDVHTVIANWQGLAPEERWWLYTTANATHHHPGYGKDRGWRKAIRVAFAENPVAI